MKQYLLSSEVGAKKKLNIIGFSLVQIQSIQVPND